MKPLLIITLVLFATPAHATEHGRRYSHGSDYSCEAWTTCYNGRQLYCWSEGASCRWEYGEGAYVLCSSVDHEGTDSWYRESCY